jgi:transposase
MTIRLHLRAIRVLEVEEDLPEALVVSVVAIAAVIRCGRCGAKTNRVHATKLVKVADLPHGGRPTTLLWHRRRFRCRRCRATTTESHPLLAGRMTTRPARAVVRDCADMTVSAAARRCGLGWHKVMALVLAHGTLLAKARRRRACRVLLVDEKAMRKGHNNFSTILTDGDRARVIAVIEGRTAEVLGTWLSRQSPAWRRGVKVVVTDMAECYRKAVRTHLPAQRPPRGRSLRCGAQLRQCAGHRPSGCPAHGQGQGPRPLGLPRPIPAHEAPGPPERKRRRPSSATSSRPTPNSAWSGPWCSAST